MASVRGRGARPRQRQQPRFKPRWVRRRKAPVGPGERRGARVVKLVALALVVVAGLPAIFSLGRRSARFAVEPELLAGSTFVSVAGHRIRCVHAGPTSAGAAVLGRARSPRSVVLIHGSGASAFTWRQNIPEWSSEFDVWALDLPGYGLSDKPRRGAGSAGDPYATETQAAVVAEFMNKIGLRGAVVAGSSMGGAVALELAMTRPELVEGLVLVDCSVPVATGTGHRRTIGFRSLSLLLRIPGLNWFLTQSVLTSRPVVRRFLESAYADPRAVTPEIVDGYLTPLLSDDAPSALLSLARSWLGEEPGPLSAPLTAVDVPTLVVWGENDRWVPLEVGRQVAQDIRGARFEVIPGCGHLPHEEDPRAVNRLVAEFVRGLGTRGRE